MSTVQSSISRAPRPSSLADVLDLILDKGLVIDAYVRVSVVGIEILTIDARVVVASVDTYLRFAEAVNRLDLGQTETAGLKELVKGRDSDGGHEDNGSKADDDSKPGVLERAKNELGRVIGHDDSGQDGHGNEPARPRQRPADRPSPRRDTRDEDSGSDGDSKGGLMGRLADRGKWS